MLVPATKWRHGHETAADLPEIEHDCTEYPETVTGANLTMTRNEYGLLRVPRSKRQQNVAGHAAVPRVSGVHEDHSIHDHRTGAIE